MRNSSLLKRLILGLYILALSTATSGTSLSADTDKQSADGINIQAYEAFKRGEYGLSYRLSSQAEMLSIETDDKAELARAKSNIASNLYYLGKLDKALELYKSSLNIASSIDDIEGQERAINNISNVYAKLENFHEALKYRQELIKLTPRSKDPESKSTAYLSIASVYIELGQIQEAKESITIVERALEEHPSPFLKSYLYLRKAAIASAEEDYVLAIEILNKAIVEAKRNHLEGLEIGLSLNSAEVYLKLKHTDQALSLANFVLERSAILKRNDRVLDAHQLLGKIYQVRQDFEKALGHFQTANAMEKDLLGEKVKTLAEITKIEKQVENTQKQLEKSRQLTKIAELKLTTQTQRVAIAFFVMTSLGIIAIFILNRRANRRELARQRQLNQELKALDKVKDRILTNTSHELRTPLNGIIGLSQMLHIENEEILSGDSLNSLKLIENSGLQLAEIVNDIVDLAKLRSNYSHFKKEKFDVLSSIKEILATCEPLLKGKDIQLQAMCELNEIIIQQDKKRFKQVLFNLIGNAIKFTDRGSISVKTRIVDSRLLLVVSDTGIGIPENMQKRVFHGFEQVSAENNREHGGSGLGLAICQEIISAMSGEIELTSQVNKGTQVTINLPFNNTSS